MTDVKPKTPTAQSRINEGRTAEVMEIGWCEYIDMPSLGLKRIRAKMDTGAATSAIHATRIKRFERDGLDMVEFWFREHPGDRPRRHEAPLLERRTVRSSNGERQERYVIEAQICLGKLCWIGQLTLADRRNMAFPILVGRRSLKRGFVVNSRRRWVLGKPKKDKSL